MPTPEEILEAAAEAALGPKSVSQDGTTVVARDVKDIQAAVTMATGSSAAALPERGLRFTKLRSPGAN